MRPDPWGNPHGWNGQMLVALHHYKSTQFHTTSNGEHLSIGIQSEGLRQAQRRLIGCHGRSKVAQRMFRLRHGRHGRREVLSMFKTVAQRSPRRKAHASPWSQNGRAWVGDWSPSKEMHTVVNIVYQYLCFCLPCITIVGHYKQLIRPNARDPPRTRLNTTTSQFSLPSTGDPCIIHKNKNGPVESECKLNNVNPHIIRNQIQNQIEVTLNEHRYCKLCHYQTNTEF